MRAPSVFVRELSPQEGERLRRVSRRAKHFSTRQRASILLASATKHTAPRIASMWRTDESRVRKVIHDFDERGFDSLRPDYRGGRPRRITAEVPKRIVAVADARPDTQGLPFTRWSLPKLAAYLAEREICQISPAHLGRVLPRPASRSSAPAPGRPRRTPTTRPRRPACCRSPSGLPRVGR